MRRATRQQTALLAQPPALTDFPDDLVLLVAHALTDVIKPRNLGHLAMTCLALKLVLAERVALLHTESDEAAAVLDTMYRISCREFAQRTEWPKKPTSVRPFRNGCYDPSFAKALGRILESEVTTHFTTIELQGVRQGISNVLVEKAGRGLRQLKALGFMGMNADFGDECTKALASAFDRGLLPRIESLQLSHNDIGDVGFAALARAAARLPGLKHIIVPFNHIGDEGVKALAGAAISGGLKNLEALNLSYNKVGDEGISALARAATLGKLQKLLELNLNESDLMQEDECYISDQGYLALARMISGGFLPALKRLHVNPIHPDVGDDVWDALGHACAERSNLRIW